MRKVEVIPVITEALGAVAKQYKKWLEKLSSHVLIKALQKPCLLGTYCVTSVPIWSYSALYFSVFGLNTER